MDRITRNLLEEFAREQSLQKLPEDQLFEHYCAYLVTSSHQSETVDTGQVCVGAGNDCGIDSIAVIINGALVTEPDEVNERAETSPHFDVTFVFVQAERSGSFDTAKIGQFGFGVKDVFAEEPQLVQNDDVKHKVAVINAVISHSALFKRGNPRCLLYYVTTGRWTDDQNLVARRDGARTDLEDLNIFDSVEFECLGAAEIQRLDRDSKNAVSAEIVFADRTVLPELPGVEQAYLGVLPASEFLKLVQTESKDVIASVFYDNVRHWQEWNAVNSEIKATLEDDERRPFFALLNNGITVVARRVIATANRFVVEDYQIVNGCQTSFVLQSAQDHFADDVHVPLRLIATQDTDIRNAIIKATNRQTQVTDEQLLALSDIPKSLESYFPTYDGKKRLFFERRSKQYVSDRDVEKVRVIDFKSVVRAFAAMFLDVPHRCTRSYKTLVRRVGKDILHESHRLEPYYAAAFSHYRLEFLFRNQTLPSELKMARYHILTTLRYLALPGSLPQMGSNAMKRLCEEEFLPTIWDDSRSTGLFKQGVELLRDVAGENFIRDYILSEPFTELLLTRLRTGSKDIVGA